MFFPLDNLPQMAQGRGVVPAADAYGGDHARRDLRVLAAPLWGSFAYLAMLTPAVCYAAIFLMKRRLIK